jgi:hypothetical protein
MRVRIGFWFVRSKAIQVCDVFIFLVGYHVKVIEIGGGSNGCVADADTDDATASNQFD